MIPKKLEEATGLALESSFDPNGGYAGDMRAINAKSERNVKKINEIITYLSDKEDPEQIIKAYNDLLDRQHEGEASKGECKHCHMSLAIRNPSGYCDHLKYPSHCDHCNTTADIFSKPQLKEESPKEDETPQADWVKENTNKASEEASSVSGSEVQTDYTSYYKNRAHGLRIHLVDSKGLYVESRLMTPDDIKRIESLAQQRTEKKCLERVKYRLETYVWDGNIGDGLAKDGGHDYLIEVMENRKLLTKAVLSDLLK
jgi:hypothetical protein